MLGTIRHATRLAQRDIVFFRIAKSHTFWKTCFSMDFRSLLTSISGKFFLDLLMRDEIPIEVHLKRRTCCTSRLVSAPDHLPVVFSEVFAETPTLESYFILRLTIAGSVQFLLFCL